ncbi:MAG: 4-hydroxybenzoate octaprenyltransferase [Halieaceae bacterium]|jgi:4-hydroxybenzoate polyprenyltransferase|nr:4-hydroxybenzoate octaprenyltransferase [Halieaceae bacterium]
MPPAELTMPSKSRALLEIMRFDKPIGTYLLLAPTLWGLVLAGDGSVTPDLLAIFVAGAIIMRAAGCTANDLADRNLDGHVERTRLRPLVTGAISVREALSLLVLLLAAALGLVLLTNTMTLQLAFIGAILAIIYPFMKRLTYLPQFVLGAAFSWSIPMAFAASIEQLPAGLWWLFAANLLWTVAYDTQYAMVDREDDLAVGIKSTAILFGEHDRWLIGVLQLGCIAAFIATGWAFKLGMVYFAAIAIVAAMFIWHQRLIRARDRAGCFAAFNQSKWIGLVVLAGLWLDFASR